MFRIIILLIGSIVILGAILAGALFFDAFLISPKKDAEPISFTINDGASVSEISKALEDNGVITSQFFFKTYVKLTGNQSNIQAGVFELIPGMKLSDIVAKLIDAQAQEIEITIPEGYSIQQIGETVSESLPEISSQEWKDATGSDGVSILKSDDVIKNIPSGQGLEGYLFPDTYRFRADADAKTIVETMYITLLRRLSENNIVPPTVLEEFEFDNGLTIHETLALASIIEREVRREEDMKLVAGIFFTRLKIGMALQADSTVNYITGKKEISVSLEDSRIDSPYNTYKILGLPPGPICNPGMNAIRAVLEPTDSDYLYFLTTADGTVIYSRTFNEHVANKYQYLR